MAYKKIFAVSTVIVVALFLLAFWQKEALSKLLLFHDQEPTEIPQAPFDPSLLLWSEVTSGAPWGPRDSHSFYVFNNRMWVFGGLRATEEIRPRNPNYETAEYFNDLWSSDDGVFWIQEREHLPMPPIRSASVVPFRGMLFMYGGWSPEVGYKNGIWQSSDGMNWTQVSTKPEYEEREGQDVLIFNNKLFMIGGVNYLTHTTFNDVWSSDDGIHWIEVAENIPWHGRWDHGAAVFQNAIWIMGGMSIGSVGYSDVWYSPDGASWTLATSSAPWGTRQGQTALVFHNHLFLVGGLDAKTNAGVGDTWYTDDGFNWQKTKENGRWSGREDHGVVLFNDAIWITGGMNDRYEWESDVWHSTESNAPQE